MEQQPPLILPNWAENSWNNNHHSIVDFRGKTYIVYHSRILSNRQGHNNVFERSVCIDELKYNDDGTIAKVVPTHEGPKQLKPLDPYSVNRAVTICQDEKVKVKMADVRNASESVVIASEGGAWIRYAGFAFDAAPKSVAALCRAKGSAVIEVHKGAVDGPVAASIQLSDTKGEFVRFSAAVSGIGTEKCDLYFVFGGSAAGVEFAQYRFGR